jgi:lipoprotein-anchoring transpeptidase ErfK/SrfK
MKKLIDSQWLHEFNLLIVVVFLLLFMVPIHTNKALAQPKNQIIKQKIQKLKQSQRRWIQVDLSEQRLIAWQGNSPAYAVIISSGKKKTPTLTGVFNIQVKLKKTRMRGPGYDIPNVPYAMFYDGNYGIHGAYWHKSFGTPVSRGCVNVAPNHAKWIFNWASVGTPVIVNR